MRFTMTKVMTVVTLGSAVLMAQMNDHSDKEDSTMIDEHHLMAEHHGHDSTSTSMGHEKQGTMVTKAGKSANKLAPQSTCPVMGGTIDKSLYADHGGKRVYFCCGGCQTSFVKHPGKYLKKLETMGQAAEQVNAVKSENGSEAHKTMEKTGGMADHHSAHNRDK